MKELKLCKRSFPSLALTALALASCAMAKPHHTADQLVYRIPDHAAQHWRVAAVPNEDPNSTIVARVREGEDAARWHEMVISETHHKTWGGQGVEQALAALQQQREKACQKPLEWKILRQEPASIIYEGHAKACAGQEPVYEIGRIIDGTDTRFRLAVLSHDPAPATDQRAKWLTMLQEASTRRGGP